jgi:hypothetical protein
VRFSILLPSAEGKQSGGNPLAPDMFDYRASNTFNYFSDLNPERRAVIDALQAEIRASDETALEGLFGVKRAALQAAVDANLSVYQSPLLAAVDRYSPGVMYRAADFSSLPTGSQRRLLENGIILSGLFGLLRPDDLVPDYKLSMNARVEGIGKVSAYWKPVLTEHLNTLLAGQAVWNLLPASHDDAWEDQGTSGRMIRVKFLREVDGERKPLTHGIKELRGALVAFLVNETADSVDALDLWEPPDGYEVDPDASEIDENGGGTVVMVSAPGWEARRTERRRLRAEAAAAKVRPSDDDDDD